MTALLACGGLHRKLARQQKVAAVALRNLHHVSAMTQIVYVFLQNNFHVKLSSVSGRRGRLDLLYLCSRCDRDSATQPCRQPSQHCRRVAFIAPGRELCTA